MTWTPLTLTLRWGRYFAPGVEDEQKLVDMVSRARDAGLITTRTAVQRLARQFAIDNVDAYLKALEEEAEERQAKAMEVAAKLAPGKPGEAEPPTDPKEPEE